ncbi:glutamate/gamma-aminobutyrate family transporter YjeM [Thermoanaerobacterium thermosaccharolyticum]|uniref:glutamate/gamma-aminobutyrate family transporter YjeM n=1 Tax=Thermoanaerobacterium thermosaccharolyticum TaxID=1517 RepID=UPI000C073633|nr:glutamate/gamma-aminobutyrate family transporter YjeM [Thermoanaerobacterium thermosaccharolyticum]PHO07504.1 glutamate/gamma-aminobutyrate family transporter YjeM [Thermoanaerobacterium thermosaccharolyticum]
MATKENARRKLSQISLILMIFTSVFGFTNMPRSFYLMGYGAIPWYILSGITFFIPYAFMMAEYGAAFKEESGGIYTWMEKSVGPLYAFTGTFMWYASYVVWLVNICSTIWIPLSNAIFGSDKTSELHFLGLNSTQTLGMLGIMLIIVITFVASKGLSGVSKVASIGGTAILLLNVVLLIGSVIVFIATGGKFKEPITGIGSFITSPNPSYTTPLSVLSFVVFAIFAYGGTEVVGGVVDQTENAEKTFPRGMMIAATIISIGYSLGIFLIGIFTNWKDVLSSDKINLANVAYVIMNNLGYQLGLSLGMGQATAVVIGNWVARIVGMSMFLALIGAFFTLTYTPLKQLIEGTPKELWPRNIGYVKDGIPKVAIWVQCGIVVAMIFLVSFGGDIAKVFFTRLVLMANVAMTIPYLFLIIAYPYFKGKSSIKKGYQVFKSKTTVMVVTILSAAIVGFANFFTIIEPMTSGDYASTIWMVIGPVFFSSTALFLFRRYARRYKNGAYRLLRNDD